MAEYIKREDVLQHKRKMRCADFQGGFWDFIVRCEDIERIPAADVVEVRRGEWIKSLVLQTDTSALYDYTCSECAIVSNRECNYCPNCGANMDGGGDGNDRP